MNIEIETKGRIAEGEYKNWYIYIQDLDKGQGAYLIVLTSPDHAQGYDDFVENFQALEGYFRETQWKIIWLKD